MGRASSVRLLALFWLLNLVVAVPFSMLLGKTLAESFGGGVMEDRLRDGFDTEWYGEMEAEAGGLAATFSPAILGAGAVLRNLDDLWSGRIFTAHPALVAMGVAYALAWTFFLGGALGHLARDRDPFDSRRFGADAARCFGVLLRLVLISAVPYLAIFWLARRLFGWLEDRARDVTSEQTLVLTYLAAAAIVVGALLLVRLVFDYAKIAASRGGRGALRSLLDAVVFVARRPGRTAGLYLGILILSGLAMAAYGLLAPEVGPAGIVGIAWAFLLAQAYLILRLWLRFALLGGEVGLLRELGG